MIIGSLPLTLLGFNRVGLNQIAIRIKNQLIALI